MTIQEIKKRIKPGDKIINTFGMRYKNYYEVYRDDVCILKLTYNQFLKITDDLSCEMRVGGMTKHVYTIK